MTQQLRRIGHMIERAPGNLATAARANDSRGNHRAFLADSVSPAGTDPVAGANSANDGWGGDGPAALGHPGSSADGVGAASSGAGIVPAQTSAYPVAADYDSGTDSDTISSMGDDQHANNFGEQLRCVCFFWAPLPPSPSLPP